MFLSLSLSVPQSHFQTLFCSVNPLPEFSVTVKVRQNDSVRAIRGRAVLWCLTTPQPTEPTQTALICPRKYSHFSAPVV